MKSIIAFLLGLLTVLSTAQTDSPDSVIDWSSDSADDNVPSYGGLSFKVYQSENDEGALTVVLSADKAEKKDKIKRVYCLSFAKIFEATGYDPACVGDCDYETVDYTEVELEDANCVITPEGTTAFNVVCDSVAVKDGNGTQTGNATLTLAFKFGELSGEYGLEYSITLEDYVMRGESTSFVMEQTITDCTAEYGGSSSESSEESVDTDTDTDTETDTRRRLVTDSPDTDTEDTEDSGESDSENESAGVSSDDSDEFDFEAAQFILSGTATDDCTADGGASSVVDYYMVYQGVEEAVQIVFEPFTCTLSVDPWFKIDGSRLDDSGNSVRTVCAIVFGFVLAMFAF